MLTGNLFPFHCGITFVHCTWDKHLGKYSWHGFAKITVCNVISLLFSLLIVLVQCVSQTHINYDINCAQYSLFPDNSS